VQGVVLNRCYTLKEPAHDQQNIFFIKITSSNRPEKTKLTVVAPVYWWFEAAVFTVHPKPPELLPGLKHGFFLILVANSPIHLQFSGSR
jgi:hypothetical protein